MCYNDFGCFFMFKKVYVEITNNCNLDCSFCIGNERKKMFISKEDFSLLLDKLDGYTKYLYFHVMGEPLLHPFINDLIDMASKRYFVNITTNGYLIKKIANNSNIRQLNVSLHSFDPKYNKDIDTYLNDIFDSVDSLVSNTFIKFRLWTKSDYSDYIISKLNQKYDVNIGEAKSMKLASNVYFEVEEEFIWPSLDNDYYNEIGSCRGTRNHIGVLVDGTVIPCCLDSAGVINLGNIYKNDINDIINGDLFNSIKKGFLCNKKVHELCKKCNFYTLRK